MLRFAPNLLILAVLTAGAAAGNPSAVRTKFGSDGDPDRPESLRAVAVSPNGRFVALAGEPETPTGDFAVQLRDAATGDLVRLVTGHENAIRSVAFSPRGERLATITSDGDGFGVLRIFDIETGNAIQTIDAGGRVVRFLPDGRLAAASFARVLVFDPESGREVGRYPAMPVTKDVSPDGRRAVGVSHHGRNVLEVRDLGTGGPLAHLTGCTTEPLAAVFSPDGRTVAASDSRTRSVLVWEVLTGQLVHRLGTESPATSLVFAADGRHLFTGGIDGTVRSWEVATGSLAGELNSHEGAVTALAAGPAETLLSGATDRTAVLWSLAAIRGTTLPTGTLTDADLDAAWETLAGSDAAAAYRSLGLISARPAEVMPVVLARVERQLVPVADADLTRLLAGLDHADSLVRERATAELAKAGESIRPYLERALAETASPEVRSRLRVLLRRSGSTPRFSPGDLLRLRRLIGQAESLAGDGAKRLLRLIGDEFPDPAVADEARNALRRIE